MDRILRPALAELARQGTPFRGILFAGLMLTVDGPKLIEFNVRFGDPECQVLMLRLKSDLLAALVAALRRGAGGVRPALAAGAGDRGGDGGERLSGQAGAAYRNSAGWPRRRHCRGCRSSRPGRKCWMAGWCRPAGGC